MPDPSTSKAASVSRPRRNCDKNPRRVDVSCVAGQDGAGGFQEVPCRLLSKLIVVTCLWDVLERKLSEWALGKWGE